MGLLQRVLCTNPGTSRAVNKLQPPRYLGWSGKVLCIAENLASFCHFMEHHTGNVSLFRF